jgi:hypothetical protein
MEQAEEHFSRAYNVAKGRNEVLAIQAARSQYGVSCGQKVDSKIRQTTVGS